MDSVEEFQNKLIDLLSLHERGYEEHAIRCMWQLANVEPLRPVRVPDHVRRLGCPKS